MIKNLPIEIGKLPNLNDLRVDNESLPVEARNRDEDEVIEYYQDLAKQKRL
jgi:hypothetical protein